MNRATYCHCGWNAEDCDCSPWDIDQYCHCECGCPQEWTTEYANDIICIYCEHDDHFGDPAREEIDDFEAYESIIETSSHSI